MAEDREAKADEGRLSTAPELPHEVAKEYGLHHERLGASAKPTKAGAVDISQEKTILDDAETEQAVDDIVAKESDDLLAVQDGEQVESMPVRRGFWKRIGHFFGQWWQNLWARWITILLLLAGATAVAVIPSWRYTVLNTAGVRSTASVVVLDNTTQLPLKNVDVVLGGKSSQTDINGVAKFSDIKLGKYKLSVKRIAFASYDREVTIGWGSNPLGTYKLQAVGTQYTIMVSDWLSGRPIEKAEAESEQANALSDATGKIVLTVDDVDVTSLNVTVRGNGYRTETLALDAATTTPGTISLVSDRKAVFVSKQSGKYDVYSMDLDGRDKKVLLAGTGNENSSIALVVSPDNTQAALVSTRDGKRDADGFLLSALTFINIRSGTSSTVDHAQQIQLVDWIENRLIYRSTIAAASAANSQRNRLISYNYDTNARLQLATANQFNTILSAQGRLYYAVSSTDPQAALGLFRIKPDGTERERLSEQEVWTGLRVSYNNMALQTSDGWYALTLNNKQIVTSSSPPSSVSYQFADNAKRDATLWVDTREGKGTLLLQTTADGQNRTLAAQEGLVQPVRWLNDTIAVYRVANRAESADYIVSTEGGVARKLADVSPSYGYSLAY